MYLTAFAGHRFSTNLAGIRAPAGAEIDMNLATETTTAGSYHTEEKLIINPPTLAILHLNRSKVKRSLHIRGLSLRHIWINTLVHQVPGNLEIPIERMWSPSRLLLLL